MLKGLLNILYCCILICTIGSCTKDKIEYTESVPIKDWQRFLGNYQVYDTVGNYLYNAQIVQFSGINEFGTEIDSITVFNFADTMDLSFKFSYNTNPNYFDFGFFDSVPDHIGKSWHVSIIYEDTNTIYLENELNNDSMILYYHMTNLPYYINESVPYFDCNCKHVYVKQ